jgi:hypothetical protein
MDTDLGAAPVSTYVNDVVVRLRGGADLWEVAGALVDADVGVLAIGDHGRVTAVVSERDVVRARRATRPSRDEGERHRAGTVVCCHTRSTVAEVAVEMMNHYVRQVLLEDGGRGRHRVGP